MEQQTGSKQEKEYIKAVHCHRLFNLYADCIIQNAGLNEAHAGIKIAGRNINNLRYADDHPNGRKRIGTKEPLDEGGKSWPKIQRSKN